MMFDEENYELSDRMKKLASESALMKQFSPTFKYIERIMANYNKEYPVLENINITKNKLLNAKVEELELQIEKMQSNKSYSAENLLDNPYPYIFKDYKAFQFFELLHENYKDSQKPLADYSFIYRKMHKENLILETFKPEMFKEWIANEPYNKDTLEKVKTLNSCFTITKNTMYNTLKSIVYDNVP